MHQLWSLEENLPRVTLQLSVAGHHLGKWRAGVEGPLRYRAANCRKCGGYVVVYSDGTVEGPASSNRCTKER